MASAAILYSPDVLALATSLATYRLDDMLTARADARSRSCGSTLTLGLALDEGGRVERIGLRSQACAIGQASAAIFAQGAIGRSAQELVATARAVEAWLAGNSPLPTWASLEKIAPAQAYPSRHGAIMLPWNAALQILCTCARDG